MSRNEHSLFLPWEDDATKSMKKCSLWTIKEAYSKAIGLGLSLDFTKIEIPALPLREKTVVPLFSCPYNSLPSASAILNNTKKYESWTLHQMHYNK